MSPRPKWRGLFPKQYLRFLRSTEHIKTYVLGSGRNDRIYRHYRKTVTPALLNDLRSISEADI